MRRVEIRKLAVPESLAGPVEVVDLPAHSLLVIRSTQPMPTVQIKGAYDELAKLAKVLGAAAVVLPYGFDFEVWETDALETNGAPS